MAAFDAAFDVTTAVAEFVADAACTSLTLPHMSSGQRKSAKKLLEQHPEVHCESYGFGAERQLHLFKKSIDAQAREEKLLAMELVNVKNTFIDDWAAPSMHVDGRVIQSMPHGMFRKCIFEDFEATKGSETPSTTGYDTPAEVSEPEVSEASEAETGSIINARWADAQPDEFPEMKCVRLPCPGELVVVEGLVKNPTFNGRSAIVQGLDVATGRYNILIPSTNGPQQAKIKAENLRLIACL